MDVTQGLENALSGSVRRIDEWDRYFYGEDVDVPLPLQIDPQANFTVDEYFWYTQDRPNDRAYPVKDTYRAFYVRMSGKYGAGLRSTDQQAWLDRKEEMKDRDETALLSGNVATQSRRSMQHHRREEPSDVHHSGYTAEQHAAHNRFPAHGSAHTPGLGASEYSRGKMPSQFKKSHGSRSGGGSEGGSRPPISRGNGGDGSRSGGGGGGSRRTDSRSHGGNKEGKSSGSRSHGGNKEGKSSGSHSNGGKSSSSRSQGSSNGEKKKKGKVPPQFLKSKKGSNCDRCGLSPTGPTGCGCSNKHREEFGDLIELKPADCSRPDGQPCTNDQRNQLWNGLLSKEATNCGCGMSPERHKLYSVGETGCPFGGRRDVPTNDEEEDNEEEDDDGDDDDEEDEGPVTANEELRELEKEVLTGSSNLATMDPSVPLTDELSHLSLETENALDGLPLVVSPSLVPTSTGISVVDNAIKSVVTPPPLTPTPTPTHRSRTSYASLRSDYNPTTDTLGQGPLTGTHRSTRQNTFHDTHTEHYYGASATGRSHATLVSDAQASNHRVTMHDAAHHPVKVTFHDTPHTATAAAGGGRRSVGSKSDKKDKKKDKLNANTATDCNICHIDKEGKVDHTIPYVEEKFSSVSAGISWLNSAIIARATRMRTMPERVLFWVQAAPDNTGVYKAWRDGRDRAYFEVGRTIKLRQDGFNYQEMMCGRPKLEL